MQCNNSNNDQIYRNELLESVLAIHEFTVIKMCLLLSDSVVKAKMTVLTRSLAMRFIAWLRTRVKGMSLAR